MFRVFVLLIKPVAFNIILFQSSLLWLLELASSFTMQSNAMIQGVCEDFIENPMI